MGSSVHQNKPWSDKYAGCAPQELSLPETNMTYVFEESVKRVPDVDAPRRFDETISYSELNDFADRFATLPTSRGVEKGGKVVDYAQDKPQFLIAQYGAYASSTAPYRSMAEMASPMTNPLADFWAVSRPLHFADGPTRSTARP